MRAGKRVRWLSLLAILALIVAACGSDGGATETTDGGATETTDSGDASDTTEAADTTVAEGGDDGELDQITWISPRGTLQVMDDYNLWIPIEMGYFEELGLQVELIPGSNDSTAPTKFVAENQADVGYPSPGVLTSSIASGIDVVSIYNMIPRQVFNFAVQPGSDIQSIADLEGKSISLWAPGGQVVADPMLFEAGVSPDDVEYVTPGAQWGQAVSQGQADAALGWDGLRAQWEAQGLELDWVLGRDFSVHPSNVYSVRHEELQTEEGRDLWTRFLKGVVMGKEFARVNPRAAAQITYNQLPDLQASVEPELALASMLELAESYSTSERAGQGWGYHDPDGWQNYLETIAELGQVDSVLDSSEVFTNELLEAANDIDLERVQADAESFELDDTFGALEIPEGYDY